MIKDFRSFHIKNINNIVDLRYPPFVSYLFYLFMGKKYLLFAIFIFVLTGIQAQIPVLNLKKNIFKMDTAIER